MIDKHIHPCACFKCAEQHKKWSYHPFDKFYKEDISGTLGGLCDTCGKRPGSHWDAGECEEPTFIREKGHTKTYFNNATATLFRKNNPD